MKSTREIRLELMRKLGVDTPVCPHCGGRLTVTNEWPTGGERMICATKCTGHCGAEERAEVDLR